MKDILDKVSAQHFTIQITNPNKDNPTQAFFLGPEANGVKLPYRKLDTPYRKFPQTGFAMALLTDPWAMRIELRAQSQQPAQQ
jgi:hypothetical protein